ncbi:2-isopropylmalate synthase (plasmid) [Buchnera aphidicola (Aphis craccivore)]|uniref:2-isopropylmalate synthase n=1 Tax=Buchnera aphidicola (Aphis craccivora) TaxID=466616 RepID=A0AA95E514_9GAMM|nr:2-isopropylmalate synthase [Buchnera aphidicola]QLL40992.1 2-isopropylmalate synthase [Buchnera aphidicola (Aphis craccivore)]WAI18088.1 MAG: 2-isopropylmalate synthase [Buchnera aphidicola (Aphis craccivora)]
MNSKIIIFDTTLRDGEQALQASLSVKQKLQIALSLENSAIDIIEVGFPISSPGDFTSVQEISKKIKNSKICSLARCINKDIDVAAEAMSYSDSFRIHIFLATSTLHMESKLNKSFDQIIDMAISSVKRALRYTDDIEFSCEDASRTTPDNLCRIVEKLINSGVKTINIPDTVGYTVPNELSSIIKNLFQRVPNIDKSIISVHCHNDLGMAVGNSISAIQAGARQIEGTINGIGERAGNTALEEVIMAIKVRQDILKVSTNIKHKEIYRTSKIISQICNMPIPPNKAIVGSNAFAHSSGIHQDGVLKNRKNYEIMEPSSIGLKEVKLNLTSRSGRAAVKHYMTEMGYKETDYNMDELYTAFLKLADKKGQVFDYDLEALAFFNTQQNESEYFSLSFFSVQSISNGLSTASVKLLCGGNKFIESATTSNGPVDAIYQAINRITHFPIILQKYQLIAKGKGEDALGQVNILVQYKKRKFHGVGLATDIIESSAQAMINVLNTIWKVNQVNKKLKNLKRINN